MGQQVLVHGRLLDPLALQNVGDLLQLRLSDHKITHHQDEAVGVAGESGITPQSKARLDTHPIGGHLQVRARERDTVDLLVRRQLPRSAQSPRDVLPPGITGSRQRRDGIGIALDGAGSGDGPRITSGERAASREHYSRSRYHYRIRRQH